MISEYIKEFKHNPATYSRYFGSPTFKLAHSYFSITTSYTNIRAFLELYYPSYSRGSDFQLPQIDLSLDPIHQLFGVVISSYPDYM